MRNRYDFHLSQDDDNRSDNDSEYDRNRKSIHSVSYITAIIFLSFLLGLLAAAFFIEETLPTPLNVSDEKSKPDAFIAERAQKYLKLLTDLGPRVAGSYENEMLAVDILKREINQIIYEAHPNQSIELDVQTVSGSYFLGFKPHGIVNSYANVQNVIVRVNSRSNSSHGVLINAHFDSVPTSPGGSDDGINCAAMLEILRIISHSPSAPRHNIVFLFNGAEETPLQAAHGFITQHAWSKLVNVVVNLEAAGHGGKIQLFQTGPKRPWLMKYYGRVPHPSGQATGEELFQSNVIPSDTDFRVFRDFGGLIGYDMAFIKHGYRYHTKHDDFAHIPAGSFQHVGDNTLSLVRDLSEAPELDEPEKQTIGVVTFYDVFGLFLISYNDTLAIILNILGIVLSVTALIKSLRDYGLGFSKQTFKYLGVTLVFTIVGWLLAIASVFFIGFILDALNYPLSWYRNPVLLVGLYVMPAVICCTGSLLLMNKFFGQSVFQKNWSQNIQAQIQIHVTRLIWTLALAVGTLFGMRSVYVLLIVVTFNSVAFILLHVTKLHRTAKIWLIIYILGSIVPTLFMMVNAVLLESFIIPVCGRIGNDRNPELIIGAVTLLLTLIITWVYVPLITLVRKPFIVIGVLAAIFFITFFTVFTPLGFQYSGNPDSPAPQRYWLIHHSRIFRDESNNVLKKDSGFFSLNFDRNSPGLMKTFASDIDKARSVTDDCKLLIFCGLPVLTPRQIDVLEKSTWIPAGQPVLSEETNITVVDKTVVSEGVWQYNVSITGPQRMTVFIALKDSVNLTYLSLVPTPPDASVIWNNRRVFTILHVDAQESNPLDIAFKLEVPKTWKDEKAAEIGVTATYVYAKKNRLTPQFQAFLGQFPEWADVVPYLGSFNSWFV